MSENVENAPEAVHHLKLAQTRPTSETPVQVVITMNPDGMIRIDNTPGISHQQLFTMNFVFEDFVRCIWKGQLK